MSMTKKWVWSGLVIALAVGLSFSWVYRACAAGPHNVANTVHNLSKYNGSNQYRTDSEQVCVFCHTPHGGTVGLPLWNHDTPGAGSFSHYNSTTVTSAISADPGRQVSAESLLCLSCHDGSVATNRVLNPPQELGGAQPESFMYPGPVEVQGWIFGSFSRIGGAAVEMLPGVWGADDAVGNLTDDHPISFSYYDAQLEDNTGLRPPGSVVGPRFFGLGEMSGGMMVECSTCHDPHVDYISNPAYAPFLIMSNDGSALCLACHIK